MNNLSIFIFSGLLIGLLFVLLVGVSLSSLWESVQNCRSGNTRVWLSPFECGCLYNLHPACYFGFNYLALLVFFVIFDLEVVLILNIPFQGPAFKSFWYYYFFILVLVMGYSVEANRGYANWGM